MQRTARAAIVVGSALAAPLAAVGVASAVSSPGPAGEPAPPAPSPAPAGATPEVTDADVAAAEAFFARGYAYCDAEALAVATGTEPWEAKVAAGARLLAGEPVDPPSGCTDDSASDPLLAFFDAGYQYCDAEALAAALGVDPYEAKLRVGAALVAGEPVDPPRDCA